MTSGNVELLPGLCFRGTHEFNSFSDDYRSSRLLTVREGSIEKSEEFREKLSSTIDKLWEDVKNGTPRTDERNFSIYTGRGGFAYLCLRLAQSLVTSENQQDQVNLIFTY